MKLPDCSTRGGPGDQEALEKLTPLVYQEVAPGSAKLNGRGTVHSHSPGNRTQKFVCSRLMPGG